MRAVSLPLVSVLMPVRSVQFFAPALDSILSQTGVDFEVICIDDSVEARTSSILAKFSATQPKLRVLRNRGRGVADALNSGLASARGELIARMDADDISLPHRLTAQASYLEMHPEIGVLGTQADVIDASGARIGKARVPVGSRRVFTYLQTGNPLIHPTVMMRRGLLSKVGGYRRSFEGAEDYDLWLRLSAQTAMDNLAGVFLLHRRHNEQVTARVQFRQARLATLAIVSHNIRHSSGRDPLSDLGRIENWRNAIGATGPSAVADVRELTAAPLADNRGTLRESGARYLNAACYRAIRRGSPDVCARIALACVRHQLQLYRAGRRTDALMALFRDALRWRTQLIRAYAKHARVLLPAARPAPPSAMVSRNMRHGEPSSPVGINIAE
jgi:hypothetical protein